MKRIFQVLAMLMVFGPCFVACSSGGGGSSDDDGALTMELIHLYDRNDDDNEITGRAQVNAVAAQIGAVEMIVHSSSDNEYRIQSITGSNFLVADDFEVAMEQAGYWVASINGYNLCFIGDDYKYHYYKEY